MEPAFLERLRERQEQRSLLAESAKALAQSPLATMWSLLLFVGGSSLLTYYWHISYFPNLDLDSAASLLAAVSFATILVLFFTVVIFVIPGIFWEGTTKNSLRELHVPDGNVFAPLVLFLWLLLGLCYSIYESVASKSFFVFVLLAVTFVGVAFGVTAVLVERGARDQFVPFAKVVASSIVSAGFASIGIWLFFVMMGGLRTEDFVTLAVFLLLCNGFIAARPSAMPSVQWSMAVGVVVLYVLLMLGGLMTKVPMGIAKLFKIGNFDAVLVLDGSGCKTFPQLKGPDLGDGCATQKVLVLSRLGGEYYVEYKPTTTASERIVIPGGLVKGLKIDVGVEEK